MDACGRIERVVLGSVSFFELDSFDRWERFPSMKQLLPEVHSRMSVRDQLQLIKKPPQLNSLTRAYLDEDSEETPTSELCGIRIYCPDLRDIKLENWSYSDKGIAEIINNCTDMTGTKFTFSRFGDIALNFGITDILGVTEEPQQNTMTNSINTTSAAIVTTMKHHPKDWVCLDLETLRIFIYGLEKKPPEWHKLIFAQIARPTKLHELNIGP
ncbi:hypothetical protein BGX26_011314 [Mortierella sp. AD094]|nr:hypothetical protein BGX26_011314 [Mortierella sp. AD094]